MPETGDKSGGKGSTPGPTGDCHQVSGPGGRRSASALHRLHQCPVAFGRFQSLKLHPKTPWCNNIWNG
jgi:hypothetical protein